jgi:hypothetical protein
MHTEFKNKKINYWDNNTTFPTGKVRYNSRSIEECGDEMTTKREGRHHTRHSTLWMESGIAPPPHYLSKGSLSTQTTPSRRKATSKRRYSSDKRTDPMVSPCYSMGNKIEVVRKPSGGNGVGLAGRDFSRYSQSPPKAKGNAMM